MNVFDGFLFTEINNKKEFLYFKNRYRAPVNGYTIRIGIFIYNEVLLIKDYRRRIYIIKYLNEINKNFIDKLSNALKNPTEKNLLKIFDK